MSDTYLCRVSPRCATSLRIDVCVRATVTSKLGSPVVLDTALSKTRLHNGLQQLTQSLSRGGPCHAGRPGDFLRRYTRPWQFASEKSPSLAGSRAQKARGKSQSSCPLRRPGVPRPANGAAVSTGTPPHDSRNILFAIHATRYVKHTICKAHLHLQARLLLALARCERTAGDAGAGIRAAGACGQRPPSRQARKGICAVGRHCGRAGLRASKELIHFADRPCCRALVGRGPGNWGRKGRKTQDVLGGRPGGGRRRSPPCEHSSNSFSGRKDKLAGRRSCKSFASRCPDDPHARAPDAVPGSDSVRWNSRGGPPAMCACLVAP